MRTNATEKLVGRAKRELLLGEACLELLLCKILIRFTPFSYWSRQCGTFQLETVKKAVPPVETERVARAIERSTIRIPWKALCLDRALSAQRMLARRGLDSTLYFGMRQSLSGKWEAHCWIRCGSGWVVGYLPEANYTVVGTYARFGSRSLLGTLCMRISGASPITLRT